jgi:uncharacterized protein (TIGR02265 family)
MGGSGTPQIKGSILLSRRAYLRERGGEPLFQRVSSRLPLIDRTIVEGTLLATSWYPLELNLRLDDAIADELSTGNRSQVFIEMGRASAEQNLKTVHQAFIRQGDPHFLLSNAPRIYRLYYAVGYRTYERAGPSSATLRTFDAESVTATDCMTVIGWHQRGIELSGGKNAAVVELVCRSRGGPHCEYRCAWA